MGVLNVTPDSFSDGGLFLDPEAAVRRGIEMAAEGADVIDYVRLCVDPGIGFGKTLDHNLELLRRIDAFAELGRPVLVGPSRKSFLGKLLGTDVGDRLEGTAAAVAWVAGHGAHIVRV